MNEPLQAELRALREEQSVLRRQLRTLDERLARFETQAADALVAEEMALPNVTLEPPRAPVAAATLPPPLPPSLVLAKEAAKPALSLDEIAADAGWRSKKPPLVPPATPVVVLANEPPLSLPIAEPAAGVATAPKRESLEMQIGTVWLVRAGVVAVLTALVFAGAALYQNVVPHLGPAAKVALLYLGAGALTGAGAWLERSRQARENPRLRNYAQVIFAGGLAAVYYVTYAAHYIERLRVIDNALVAGAALLAWTAFMVTLAHRRKSETLATVAILLGFYTSAVNDGVASFTLVSNLILAGGSVFLLRRHLWRVFPYASVLATFGSYAFWTYHGSILDWQGPGVPPVHGQHGPGGFWIETAFLAIYWALFTWAAFTAGEGVLSSYRRAGFVSLNNSAFFLLTTWLVLGQGPGWFWRWSLGFGAVLLALAEACRRLPRPADPKTEDAYLLQGVLLVTTGFVAYFEGWQLSLVLAVQAVVLMAAAGRRSNVWLVGCSLVTALLAFGWAMHGFEIYPHPKEWITPSAVGALLVGAAYLAQCQKTKRHAAPGEVDAFGKVIDRAPSLFSLLGCIVWFALIPNQAPGTDSGILFYVGAAVLLTASIYALRIKALTIYAQAFLAMGALIWSGETLFKFTPSSGPNVWTMLGPLAGALALGHWWQLLPGQAGWTRGRLSQFFSGIDAVLVVGTILAWFLGHFWTEERSMGGFTAAGSSGLALAVFAYAVLTRYRALAVAAQSLLLAGVLFFVDLCGHSHVGMSSQWEILLAAVPLLVLLLMLTAAHRLLPEDRRTTPLRLGIYAYEVLATAVFLAWAGHYFYPEALMPTYALAGAAVFALGVEQHVRRWTVLSIVPTLAAVVFYLLSDTNGVRGSWLVVPGILLLIAQQQLGRRRLGIRLPGWFPAAWQNALLLAAVICGWVFVSELAGRARESAFTLAFSWSVFAAVVLTAGIFLRERMLRWAGLGVLAVTFGHLMIFDIMQLGIVGKAVGFAALGAVLIGAGFLYIKFQDKFRDLL